MECMLSYVSSARAALWDALPRFMRHRGHKSGTRMLRQVRHRRGAGVRWTAQAAGNVFAKGQALALEAGRDLQEGEILYMDYGSGGAEEKLDSQILLDYGAFDPDSNQVRACSNP